MVIYKTMFKLNGMQCIIVLCFIKLSLQARILGVIPAPAYSHQIVFKQLWRELALRGHDVTVITTNPSKDNTIANLKEIDISLAYDLWEFNIAKIIKDTSGFGLVFLKETWLLLHNIIDIVLAHPDVEKIINNKSEHFDLVMIKQMHSVLYAFKQRFNCSIIAVSSLDARPFGHAAVGNAVHLTADFDSLLKLNENVSFFERVFTVLIRTIIYLYNKFPWLYKNNELIRKHFGEGYSSVEKLIEDVDMLFINLHPVLHAVRPIVPATVMIGGGIHLEPPKPLPKDLQQYLDANKAGVIYFSLGSVVKSKDISPFTKSMIMEVFSELPYNVLWKYELDDLSRKPANVKLIKWAPQQDILRHPNVLVFISQCGLQSTEEALLINIPVLAMPIFADQEYNAKLIEKKGFGIYINYAKMTKSEFKESLLELIRNPIYKNQAKHLSRLILDEPMTGIEKAVWWTEYVLRNKGNLKHLKSNTVDMPTYQYYLIDVITFCIFTMITLFYCFTKMFNLIKTNFYKIINIKLKTI